VSPRPRPLIAHVVGARPNYMKVAPVYAALERSGEVEQRLLHTGQHYDSSLSDVFFAELPLPRPHVLLEVGSGTHGEQTAGALVGLERAFLDMRPDLVVVPGDINSTLAGALAAVKLQIPVCHLEAGLRSFDQTMPEEHNRRLTDVLSSLLLTHSPEATDNLVAEGVSEDKIVFVGNTMIDTLFASVARARQLAVWRRYGLEEASYLLVTLHRPALVDSPLMLGQTLAALERISGVFPVIFPMHPRTAQRIENLRLTTSGIVIAPPLPYSDFLSLELGAAAVITDSGGVQEETTALRIPCFTLRENTERPVTLTHGTNTLLGLDPSRLADIPELLEVFAHSAAPLGPPFWDGCAAERAATAIEAFVSVEVEQAAA
jgi:UDP-N-acetylglucosamine 2-epimerase (non-hydrolysing)